MIDLLVNGELHSIDVPPDTPLLWVLRDHLSYTGTKYGCGMGLCGACTVHLNGSAIRSCQTRLGDVGNAAITTIEGLSVEGDHPVQRAWIEHDVPQCGYCQAGQIMTASAFLSDNPRPSTEEIETAMSGNICRCGTYNRIREAVRRAAELAGEQ